ncbi:MAG: adenylate cyclase [Butyrivibrio sp.]|nr:adenylate cyclase [Butyrivibrio sp.]
MGVEIEKKFTLKNIPENLDKYQMHYIEQGYLNVSPAIRVRREDDHFYMTYKGQGIMSHEEYNLPLDKESYEHLVDKADGHLIKKKRYLIPLNENAYTEEYLSGRDDLKKIIKSGEMKIELDIFEKPFDDIRIAEVEFPDEDAANNYNMADWFKEDVTSDRSYSNARLSQRK